MKPQELPLIVALILLSALPAAAEPTLDAIIAADCAKNGEPLPPLCDDATFLRRVYLHAVGRIPTLAEAHAFLDSQAPDRRQRLIDDLLSSEGYAKHWFTFWADLLRLNTDGKITRSGIVGGAYTEWLLRVLKENLPFDELTRRLIARQGNVWEPENAGAVGFYQRDFGMPLDHFASLMRVFAGTRMECAQCHNHPFDRWTQMDFYHMAGFTHSLRAGKYPEVYERISGPEKSAVNRITIPMRFASVLPRPYPLKLPHDYAYDDAAPLQEIPPETVLGQHLTLKPGEAGAEVFAAWLTDADHPRFTRVLVNRLWAALFGAPLVPPPLDDLRDDTAAWNPELEQEAMRLMQRENFNLRSFLAIVMKTEAWQRRAQEQAYDPGSPARFASPYLQRLTAEQVWDSMLVLIIDDPERPNDRSRAYRLRYLTDLRSRAQRVCAPNPIAVKAWLGQAEGRRYAASNGKAACPEADELQARSVQAMKDLDRVRSRAKGSNEQFAKWKNLHTGLFRACELEQPAPRGHFLRLFGQSDREIIGNANHEASIPQALELMNGEITAATLNPFSALMRAVHASPDRPSRLATLHLGILTRLPTQAELDAEDGFTEEDIAAALLSTQQFLFLR